MEAHMSAGILLPFQGAIETLPRKRFTRDEVERLMGTGIFDGERWELIDGELIDKMGQNPPHAAAIRLIHAWLVSLLGAKWVQVQLPIEASAADRERSLPEPDLSVIEPKREHHKRHPRGDEVLLVVEVADSSVAFDLTRKAILYAGAGVREYWVLDLVRRMLIVHRQPDGSTYRLIQLFSEGDTVVMEGRTESIAVSDILPAQD
jgi:Uma2 family endonuclease